MGEGSNSSLLMIGFLVLMFAFFYFMVIRPQKKQQKEAQNRINALKSGDKVVTIGGFYGKVKKVLEDGFLIELAEGVVVKIAKQGIAYPQAEPVKEENIAEETADDTNSQGPVSE